MAGEILLDGMSCGLTTDGTEGVDFFGIAPFFGTAAVEAEGAFDLPIPNNANEDDAAAALDEGGGLVTGANGFLTIGMAVDALGVGVGVDVGLVVIGLMSVLVMIGLVSGGLICVGFSLFTDVALIVDVVIDALLLNEAFFAGTRGKGLLSVDGRIFVFSTAGLEGSDFTTGGAFFTTGVGVVVSLCLFSFTFSCCFGFSCPPINFFFLSCLCLSSIFITAFSPVLNTAVSKCFFSLAFSLSRHIIT